MRIFLRLLRYALILAATGILLGCAAIGIAYWLIAPRLPSVEVLREVRLQVPLRVYSADNKLLATFGETRRIPVKIGDVPKDLKNAFLAAEDANFYNHPGVDWQGVLRAVGLMISKRTLHVPGGSTITQQVAKNLFLWPDQSWLRKGFEAYFTVLIETLWPKQRILEVYLNIAEFGRGVFGVGAASDVYFHKPAARLSPYDGALLAAVLPSPKRMRVNAPSNYVRSRQQWILGQMRGLGGTSLLKEL